MFSCPCTNRPPNHATNKTYSEAVTFSVIILSGTELKGSLTFDGPITEKKEISGKALLDASEHYRYTPAKKDELTVFGSIVDFEHVNPIKNKANTDDEDETSEDVEKPDEEMTPAERRAYR